MLRLKTVDFYDTGSITKVILEPSPNTLAMATNFDSHITHAPPDDDALLVFPAQWLVRQSTETSFQEKDHRVTLADLCMEGWRGTSEVEASL